MSRQLGNWAIGIGLVILFGGLCMLPAAMGKPPVPELLAMGACFFALGALTIAGGIYLKALAVQTASTESAAASSPVVPRKMKDGCELCALESPVVQCKVHQLNLCGNCLAQHYDPRSCVYIPTIRKPSARVVRASYAKSDNPKSVKPVVKTTYAKAQGAQ